MDNSIKKFLLDILIAIETIEAYIGDQKIYNDYQVNNLLKDAVERNLITIGEAVNNLLKVEASIQIGNARKIVDTRNRLTHGYDDIDDSQIWAIIINHLPKLKLDITDLLKK
ncbi:HepT-like ribonuclease domain-containing protein [Pedobacter rhodius]|uniref:DUF86 domain-containing protein n=1 Tax=Pedobacter rhodius TaxID=3004098 RepID=A0ABT4L267_9SPHI|nr:HepT-like ribonuclease domain-containing protein [Pedobacter sp. SJ11]MCZ4225276.1 DUF86 domain-containing protein [Pedobacter sp. SJ11]